MASFCNKRHQLAPMNASSAIKWRVATVINVVLTATRRSLFRASGDWMIPASQRPSKPRHALRLAASSAKTADVCRPRKSSYGSTRVWVAYCTRTTARLTGRVQISLGYRYEYGFARAPGLRVGGCHGVSLILPGRGTSTSTHSFPAKLLYVLVRVPMILVRVLDRTITLKTVVSQTEPQRCVRYALIPFNGDRTVLVQVRVRPRRRASTELLVG
eukprot:scaffold534172_cov15-Prasinocladus_malaysianus.AAC.1